MSNNVLITGALHQDAVALFESHPLMNTTYLPDCPREKLESLVSNTHVLVTRSETAIDRKLLDLAPDLKVIARAAVGVGNIDLDYATKRGILVVNCPGKNTNSAAELTLGLLVSLLRHIPQACHHLKSGGWDRHRFTGQELRGKRVALIGLGNVGQRVAKFAHGFDMEVEAYDPYIAPEIFARHRCRQRQDLAELIANCDILSVHVPLNRETKGMITAELLSLMPQGSFLINAARGGIIDENLILAALDEGRLAGAAIDTFATEPKPLAKLLAHERVLCTPHIGASTREAQQLIGQAVFEQVVKSLEGSVVDYPVNLPQVGVIDDPLLKSYALLAEKLGSFVGQTLDFNPVKVTLSYRGDIATMDHSLIKLGFMKGYATHVVDQYVSFVNVEQLFSQMGIIVSQDEDQAFNSYNSALKVWINGKNGKELTIGGIVFDNRYLRISLIDDFYFEAQPSGFIIIVENHDRPGVIGDVGHFLAGKGVNINSFELSRNSKGGKAMALIRTDNPLPAKDVTEMRSIANIVSVKSARL